MGKAALGEKIKIGDVCLAGDGAHASIKRQLAGVPYLSSKNLKDGSLDLSKVDYISEDDYSKHFRENSKAITKPRKKDVIFGIIGSIGQPYLVKDTDRFGLSSSAAILRPDSSVLDSKYLFYWVKGPEFQNALYSIKGGVAQSYISLEMIRSLPLCCPPLETQRKIASILSAYDDLIENNTRRIKILEEMAQAIYREWFVNFRFPGHEKVRMADSPLGRVPEGWGVKKFTDVADVLSGGTPKTTVAEYWDGSIPFFAPKDAPSQYYVTSTEKAITETGLKKCNSKLYPKETVFITARGTVGKVVMPACDMTMNQSCYALAGKKGITQPFLFLLTLQCVDYLKKNTGGATFDTIVVDTFRRLDVIRPPNHLVGMMTEKVRPVLDLCLNLILRNQNLRQTRDLLLPKLISGEVEVSELAV